MRSGPDAAPRGRGDAVCRGKGRDGISASRPPAPMRTISARPNGSPAATRCSTQSKPFSLGERAHPGRPITGLPPSSPISSRLPGSTGMPKCSTTPPAAPIALGMTSRRSTTAEAPRTSIRSAPRAMPAVRASATWTASCSTTRSEISSPPTLARRARVTSTVCASTLGLVPGSRVWTSAARSAAKRATRTSGPWSAWRARTVSSAGRGAAKGMILTVATI